jgi:hypothetical protein
VTQIPAANYLFIHYGFPKEEPLLTLFAEGGDEFSHVNPRGLTFTLDFDTAKRFCTGWHNLATSQSFPCPDAAELPKDYSQCRHCQRKTGFNPAFYHADSVSPQQQERNQQPHSLYLAHFGTGVVKVGITWAERGIARLLEQGARSAVIIKTYPSADVARQYEAKIAALPGLRETVKLTTKYSLATRNYDRQAGTEELLAAQQKVADTLGVTPDDNLPLSLDDYYFGEHTFTPTSAINLQPITGISGRCIGMLGSLLVMQQDNQQYFLPLTSLLGHRVRLSYDEVPNQHAPQQVSLF